MKFAYKIIAVFCLLSAFLRLYIEIKGMIHDGPPNEGSSFLWLSAAVFWWTL